MTHFNTTILVIGLATASFACQGTTQTNSNEHSLPSAEEAQASRPGTEPAPLPDQNDPNKGTSYEPASFGDRLVIEPEAPRESEPVKVRAGPITFRNGCEGIERSWAEGPDEGGVIELRWSFRSVPPDAMCTMALHSQWIEVSLERLVAGDYKVIAPDIGEESFSVLHAND